MTNLPIARARACTQKRVGTDAGCGVARVRYRAGGAARRVHTPRTWARMPAATASRPFINEVMVKVRSSACGE